MVSFVETIGEGKSQSASYSHNMASPRTGQLLHFCFRDRIKKPLRTLRPSHSFLPCLFGFSKTDGASFRVNSDHKEAAFTLRQRYSPIRLVVSLTTRTSRSKCGVDRVIQVIQANGKKMMNRVLGILGKELIRIRTLSELVVYRMLGGTDPAANCLQG